MSAIPVLNYIAGFVVFGLIYWLLGGIIGTIVDIGISQTGTTYNLMFFYWSAAVIIYILMSSIWVLRMYNEAQYQRGL